MNQAQQQPNMQRRLSQRKVNFPVAPGEIDRELLAQPNASTTDDNDAEEQKGQSHYVKGSQAAGNSEFDQSVQRIQNQRDAKSMVNTASTTNGLQQQNTQQNLVQRPLTEKQSQSSVVNGQAQPIQAETALIDGLSGAYGRSGSLYKASAETTAP